MKRFTFTPHYKTGTLAKYTVNGYVYEASTSTNPSRPIQVATMCNGFVDPRSLATYWTPEEAIDEVERRASAAIRAHMSDEAQP